MQFSPFLVQQELALVFIIDRWACVAAAVDGNDDDDDDDELMIVI